MSPEDGVRMVMNVNGVDIPEGALSDFCRRNHIRRLALFGSILREDFGPESDVDVLVEFEPGTRVGLRFFALERELSQLIGRKVDLNAYSEPNRPPIPIEGGHPFRGKAATHSDRKAATFGPLAGMGGRIRLGLKTSESFDAG